MYKRIIKSLAVITCITALPFSVTLTTKENVLAATVKSTDKIEISKKSIKMKVGSEISIGLSKGSDVKVKITTGSKNKDFKAEIENGKNIKLVNKDGGIRVKALKKGTATIKIMLKSNPKVSKSIKIIVSKKDSALGKIVKVTNDNFKKEVLKAKGTVVVNYTTAWCGYCQLLEPLFKQAAKIRPIYKFARVNAEDNEELVRDQQISGYPELHLYRNGKLVKIWGYVENMTVWDILDWVER